ncbi:MAG: hypothetical protein GXY34_12805, partial [Syntrophomonadaceae bacterium]|nr:hypothetical protein [Syntrophomonadaceae bacterium]
MQDSIGDFALFSLSDNSQLQINGSKITINGDIHTNNDFIFSGSSIVINGTCEASGKIDIKCPKPKITNLAEGVSALKIKDLSEDITAIAIENSKGYDEYQSDKQFIGNNTTLNKSIIVNG